MARPKSNDTSQEKALRKLLLQLGLNRSAASGLMQEMAGRLTDLSAKACEVQLYIAAHPEVKDAAAYAAVTLRNYARKTATETEAPGEPERKAPRKMELWGYDD